MTADKALDKMTEEVPGLKKMVDDKIRKSLLVNQLIQARAQTGLSQKEVAKRTHLKWKDIKALEFGEDAKMNFEHAARYLDVIIRELIMRR